MNEFKIKLHDVFSENLENVFIENVVNYNLNINTQYNKLITKILKCNKVNKNDFFLFYITYNKKILNNTINTNNLSKFVNKNKLYITILPTIDAINLKQYLTTTLSIIDYNKHNYDMHLSNINNSYLMVTNKIKNLHRKNIIIFNISSDCVYISNMDYNKNKISIIYNFNDSCSFIPFNINKTLDSLLIKNIDNY